MLEEPNDKKRQDYLWGSLREKEGVGSKRTGEEKEKNKL